MPFRMRESVVKGSVCALAVWTGGVLSGCSQPASEKLAQSDSAIIGGKLDTADKGVVSLLKAVQGGFYPACSGTLLTQNLVLTAHHCVAELNSSDGASVDCTTTQFQNQTLASKMLISVEANVGTDGLNPFKVAQVWVPPGDNSVCGRDIALLLLSGSGVPAGSAKPIEPSLTRQLAANEVFAAVGFGLQDPKDQTGATAGHRMSVSNAKVYCDGTACGTDLVKAGEFIADSPVCSGDSGGPALDQDGRVSGVTSRGDDKCTVAIYSSVSAWRDFIVEKTFAAATSGHYNPPAWAGTPPAGFDPGVVPTAGSGGAAASSGGSSGASGGASNNGGSSSAAGNASSGSDAAAGTAPLTVVGGGSSAGGASTGSPTIDPLGLSCDGQCPGSYKCWAASSQPPGICVPECSQADTTCPDGFECDTTLSACIQPNKGTLVRTSSSCNLSAAPATHDPGSWLGLGLGLLGWVWRKRGPRRRAQRA